MTSRSAVSVDHATGFTRVNLAFNPNYPAAIVLMPAGHDTNFDVPPSGAVIYVFRLTTATTLLFRPPFGASDNAVFKTRF